MENLIGTTIGNYQVAEKLGRGGMANVYKAYHPGLAVHRALKVIRPELVGEQGFSDRFRLEARAVAGLRHPNIVQVHDFGQHENLFYMVMEFVEGENLRDRIQREGPIRPFTEALRIVEQLAAGLGYAHENDVLHRDVKPENILLSTDGQAILADFGIAKMLASTDPKLTATGIGIGTPAYMAPELAMGSTELTPAADLYAVGVVLYETLTAHSPFVADTPLAVLQRVIHDPVPPPREFTADIPDALQGVVLKSMAKNPTMRYPNAAAFIEASRQSMLGMGPDQTPQGGTPAVPPLPPAAVLQDHPTTPMAATGGSVPTPPLAPTTPAATSPSDGRSSRGRGPLIAIAVAVCFLMLALAGGAAVTGWRWFNGRQAPDVEPLAESQSPPTSFGLSSQSPEHSPGNDATTGMAGDKTTEISEAGSNDTSSALPETTTATHSDVPPTGEDSGGSEQARNHTADGSSASSLPASNRSASNRSASNRSASTKAVSGSGTSGARRSLTGAATGPTHGSDSRRAETGVSGTGVSGTGASELTTDVPARRSHTPAAGAAGAEVVDSTLAGSAGDGPRFAGRLRFGYATVGEVEPEEVVAYELELRRPTTIFFDIVSANRRGTYTLFDPDGEIVFQQKGSDFGPLRLESTGAYNLTVETEGELPLEFEVAFVRTGS